MKESKLHKIEFFGHGLGSYKVESTGDLLPKHSIFALTVALYSHRMFHFLNASSFDHWYRAESTDIGQIPLKIGLFLYV